MSTTNPLTVPSIPATDGSPEGNYNAIMSIKQNLEIAQGTRGIVRASQIHGPTAVNTAINAALRAVNNA
jgi:hypothetical protein